MPNPRPARRPPSPGERLQQEALARGWTPDDTARAGLRGRFLNHRERVEWSALQLEHLVHDDPPPLLTGELALLLARAFGTTMRFWIGLETAYREWEENDE